MLKGIVWRTLQYSRVSFRYPSRHSEGSWRVRFHPVTMPGIAEERHRWTQDNAPHLPRGH